MRCSCRSWDLTGIPCCHAITCIISEGNNPEKYICDYYSVQRYWDTYDNVMTPMDGHTLWPPSQYDPVLPPLVRKMPGRPKKKRVYTNDYLMKRDKNDPTKMSKVGRVMTCTSCHKEGHNKRTCVEQVHSNFVLSFCLSYKRI
ncbi:hypothetical protein LINPERPRIM_LOCUS21255 [Linum perenne]